MRWKTYGLAPFLIFALITNSIPAAAISAACSISSEPIQVTSFPQEALTLEAGSSITGLLKNKLATLSLRQMAGHTLRIGLLAGVTWISFEAFSRIVALTNTKLEWDRSNWKWLFLSDAGRLFALQGLILNLAMARVIHGSVFRMVWLTPFFLLLALSNSLLWNHVIGSDAYVGFAAYMALFPIFVAYMVPLGRPIGARELQHVSPWRVLGASLLAVITAFPFALPHIFIHEIGHWLIHQLFQTPSGGEIFVALNHGYFKPPVTFPALSALATWFHLNSTATNALLTVAGTLANWTHALILAAAGLALRSRPFWRRALLLSGAVTSFFGLHYLLISVADAGGDTDWALLWADASLWFSIPVTVLAIIVPGSCLILSAYFESHDWLAAKKTHQAA